ncbi:hemolin-like [Drosophila takahashii]|uniref:hemolin-like n=1 Tax=Drosophila takahashii TaxID=29030 RepID=UPI003898F9A0
MDPLLLVILAMGLFPIDALSFPQNDTANIKLVYLRRNEDKRPTILECDFDIEGNPSFLVVKWYKDDRPISQWIRGITPVTTLEFRNSIDTFYESSSDPNKKYSSLALINPTIETTGDYRCVVQTESKMVSTYHRIQVIDLSNYSLDQYHNKIPNGTEVKCVLTNMYPKPILKILSNNGDVVKEEYNVEENENGSFNATAVVNVYETRIRSYTCQVFFKKEIQKLYDLTFNQK